MSGPARPACSVVIPSHNRARQLANTLVALARQEFPAEAFEVVVVDDGSTDDTREVVRRARTPYTLRHVGKPNRGCRSEARNAGLRLARGEIVVLLDAEMLCPPGFLAAHMALHRDCGPCIVCGWDRRLPRPVASPLPGDWEAWAASACPPVEWVPGLGNRGLVPFITSNASCRRVDAIEVGMFDEAFRGYGHEDLDLGMRLHLLGRPILSSSGTVAYHQPHPRGPRHDEELDRNSSYYGRKHHRGRHIVHVLDGLWCGGVERMLYALAKRLHGGQHRFTVVVADGTGHFREPLESLGVPVIQLRHGELAGYLAEAGPDLVHVHFAPCAWLAELLRRPPEAPIAVTVHVNVALPRSPHIGAVVCPSYSTSSLQHTGWPLRATIWPGVDLEEFAPDERRAELRARYGLPESAVVCGTATRHDSVKTTPAMFDVYLELARQREDLRVILFGEGDDVERCRDLVRSEGLEGRVLLPGVVSDFASHLAMLDICVHAVAMEPFGMAVVEAMAMGLPVVAPALGGLRETVANGETGFLCGTRQEIVDRALQFADDVALRRQMGARGRERAAGFSDRRTALKHKLLYDQVIDGARYVWAAPGHAARQTSGTR